MKYAFFDVDGTLSSPCYLVHDNFKLGMLDEEWKDYCEKYKENAYQWCKAVPEVKEYAKKLKAEGAVLFVLTASSYEYETKAKEKFVKDNYPGLFTEVYTVKHDHEKCPFILKKSHELGVSPCDCEIVEDTYRILLETQCAGIKSTHLATILTGLTDTLS